MNIIVQPQIVRQIEDNIRAILVSAWARREKEQWWRRLMKTRTSNTKREILQWMLETAGIHPMGNGGRYTFDDLTEIYWEIINEKHGAALNISVDDIEDADGSGLDRAGQWAKHIGNSGAAWPQEEAARLLREGTTLLCYDGLAFFHASHPVNAYVGASSGTFPNLITGRPFSPANLAYVYSVVEAIPAPDGKKRKLKPRIVAGGPAERLQITQSLLATFISDPVRNGGASASNVISTNYGFAEPIIDADFDETDEVYIDDDTGARSAVQSAGAGKSLQTRGVWYVACELMEDDELGGLIYQERKPFEMNSYSPMDDAALGRLDAFEWQFKGRNAASYGHPFLLYRIEP
jgi:phage major head subunit gpT-like protein